MKKIVGSIVALSFITLAVTNKNLNNSFDNAMKQSKDYRPSPDHRWLLFRSWYDNNFIHATQSEQPLIPKIIHHIWLGSPLPEKYRIFRETWMHHHPDWQFILWTDKEIAAFQLVNQTLYNEVSNYGVKSDIARYEILYRIGGLYVDTDFECLKPFDIFHETLEFYAGISYDAYAAVFNGLIGSCPGHPILKQCIDSMRSNHGRRESPDEIMQRTGPYHLTECIFNMASIESQRIAMLPVAYFYPWPHYIKHHPKPYEFIKPESHAIHHWHVSWNK